MGRASGIWDKTKGSISNIKVIIIVIKIVDNKNLEVEKEKDSFEAKDDT